MPGLNDQITVLVNENFNYWAGINFEAQKTLLYLSRNNIIPRVGESISWYGAGGSEIVFVHYGTQKETPLLVYLQLDWGGWENEQNVKKNKIDIEGAKGHGYEKGEEFFCDSWFFERNLWRIQKSLIEGGYPDEDLFKKDLISEAERKLS